MILFAWFVIWSAFFGLFTILGTIVANDKNVRAVLAFTVILAAFVGYFFLVWWALTKVGWLQ